MSFDAAHVIVQGVRVGKIMRKRIISVCIVVILVCSIYGCAQTAEDTLDAETAVAEKGHGQGKEETKLIADAAEQEEQTEIAQRHWQVYIQPDMPEPFVEVLKLYEEFLNTDIQVLNSDAWWDEFDVVGRGYLCDELCLSLRSLLKDSAEESDIEAFQYSLTDLTGDGFPELVIGRGTWLYVVYYYSETEGIKTEWHSWYFSMTLYEGGIIEYISAGLDYTVTYYQFQEETESWEKAACIIVDWDSQSDSEKYYRGVNLESFSAPVNEPMTEDEYQEIIERYTTEPVELEWTPMF